MSRHNVLAVSWAKSTSVSWPENPTPIYNNVSMRKFCQLPNTLHKNKLLAPSVPKLSTQLADSFIRMLFTSALLKRKTQVCLTLLSLGLRKHAGFQRNV